MIKYISTFRLVFRCLLVARKENSTGFLTGLTGRLKNLDPTGNPTGRSTRLVPVDPTGFHLWGTLLQKVVLTNYLSGVWVLKMWVWFSTPSMFLQVQMLIKFTLVAHVFMEKTHILFLTVVVGALGSGIFVGFNLIRCFAIARGFNEYWPWFTQSIGRTENEE